MVDNLNAVMVFFPRHRKENILLPETHEITLGNQQKYPWNPWKSNIKIE